MHIMDVPSSQDLESAAQGAVGGAAGGVAPLPTPPPLPVVKHGQGAQPERAGDVALPQVAGIEAPPERLGEEVPPLSPSPLFDSFDDLYDFVQGFCRDNGAGLVRSTSRKRACQGQQLLCYVIFVCDRGPRRASQSAGIRRSSTQKLDCPVKITASASKDWKWSYRVQGEHNHCKSLDPSAHNIHRRRTQQQQQLEKVLSKHKTLFAREFASIIRDLSASSETFFRQRDIYNDRQRPFPEMMSSRFCAACNVMGRLTAAQSAAGR